MGENIDVFDFELTDDEMARALPRWTRANRCSSITVIPRTSADLGRRASTDRRERGTFPRRTRRTMTETDAQTRAQQLIGDFAPKLVSLTDDVLFGDIWARTELSPRDRSLITVAALITGGNNEQLPGHLERARQNGVTETELKEVIIHLAFYAGWPKAMSAIQVAKRTLES
jgi:4-carboxymuconolactone decarboxylase